MKKMIFSKYVLFTFYCNKLRINYRKASFLWEENIVKKHLLRLLISFSFVLLFFCFDSKHVFAANSESDFEYEETADGSGIIIKKYKGSSNTVEIPSTIDGKQVKEIGQDSFSN